jgi:hypothetical protein
MKDANYTYDVFISHAVEDKIPLANELAARLEQEGLKVWYSSNALRVGNSITQTVHEGLDNSRFGVVILSKTYLSKNWTLREFFELLARHREGKKTILPVLLDVTAKDLAEKDLTMADLFAVPAERGLDYIVKTLLSEIRQETSLTDSQAKTSKPNLKWTIAALLLALVAALAVFLLKKPAAATMPNQAEIEQLVADHVRLTQQKVDNYLAEIRARPNTKAALQEDVLRKWTAFKDTKSYYRNTYIFSNFITTIQSKKNVNSALMLDVENLGPFNSYAFQNPIIYMREAEDNDQSTVNYVFVNTQPAAFTIQQAPVDSSGIHSIIVKYNNNIRLAEAELSFPSPSNDLKRHTLNLKGFLPTERYQVFKQNGSWSLKYIE